MAEPATEKRLTFLDPHNYVKDPRSGNDIPDPNTSEICVLLEALETPVKGIKRVYYAGRMNKYWKDPAFTNPISDTELQALSLPLPIELENERRKLKKAAIEADMDFSMTDIIKKTLPSTMAVSERVAKATNYGDDVDIALAKINRARNR